MLRRRRPNDRLPVVRMPVVRMPVVGFLGGTLLGGFLAYLWMGPALAMQRVDCSPAGGVSFICGVTNVEDFAPVPHTKWVIGGDLAAANDPQGYLYLFDTATRSVTAVKPSDIAIRADRKTYPDCPGPADWKVFGPHGLDLTQVGTRRVLYAVNHGGRESVEVFNVDLSGDTPRFTWTGCVLAPKGFWPDAVAAVPGGGMVVTSLWDPTDPDRVEKLSAGQPVGGLDSWYPDKGWAAVPGTDGMSGPNGVIASPDGKQVYLALWSGKQIAHIDLGRDPPKVDTVPTGILTDNVRWSPSGQEIFAGGQDATVKQVLTCFESGAANCNVPFKIYRVNPATLKLTDVVKTGVYGVMGAGTGAIQVGNKLWVSSFRADRIGIFPLK